MKLEEALPLLRDGHEIRHKEWIKDDHLILIRGVVMRVRRCHAFGIGYLDGREAHSEFKLTSEELLGEWEAEER